MLEKTLMVVGLVFVAVILTWLDASTLKLWEEDAIDRRMAEAQTDDPLCDDCGSVTVVRELVMRERAALLLCALCADLTKYQRKESVA